ncbi:MAG: HAMP domain-containing protein [Chloroflexi bacterium]|nr:HAMP domain-containing protein [Chloroflexota bacterium]
MTVNSLRAQLQQHGLSMAREVGSRCADLVVCNDVESLNQALEHAWQYNLDLRYILLLDSEGHILAYSIGPEIEQAVIFDLSGHPGLTADSEYSQRLVQIEHERIWETITPIINGDVGEIRVGLSESRMWIAVNTIIARLILSLGIISLAAIGVGLALTWWLTKPLTDLVTATEHVRRGETGQIVHHTARDEIGKFVVAFNALLSQLIQEQAECTSRERMRQFYLKQVIRAQEEERRRVARELHDETGQALASLMVGLRNIDEAPTQEEMRRRLRDLRDVIAETLERVKRLAHDLRPSALDDLGLTSALVLYAHQYEQRFCIKVEVQETGLGGYKLSPELETAIYRIVQEALLNAAKHASCTHVSVVLQVHNDQLVVIVEDDGCGFDMTRVSDGGNGRTQLGLYGMQERAELLGGHLEIETEPDHGCTIYLRVATDKIASNSSLAQE